MSASSKKKLRKEQEAAILTEKQRKEQAEAKKLKVNSIIFIAIMLVVVITAVTVMVITAVQNSGIIEKNTVAATVDGHEINSVEMNYYYADTVMSTYNEWYSTYGDATESYLQLMGLDLTQPLDKQAYYDGTTWADYFMGLTLDRVKSDYALYDQAVAEGFTLSEEEQETVDSNVSTMEMYALLYGYTDADDYLKGSYGPGSDLESYAAYTERSALASAYYSAYYNNLSYDDAAIREYEQDVYKNYNSYSYASYYLNCANFQSDDVDAAAAEAAAKEAAESLQTAANVDELNAAIAALEINADDASASSTMVEDALYTDISSIYRDWLANGDRQENDMTILPYESTSTDEEGNETTTVSGYYAVMFLGSNENLAPMANVRHLLVEFECTNTEEHDHTEFSEEEKAAAKAEAEGYLQTWLDGEATEESFIELVKEHSDDTSASQGGLFEDINPASSYVENFLNWSIDENRQAGDAEVIETEFGYHVMYYVGDDELTYRDYMISNDMKDEALESWYNAILEAAALTEGNLSRLNTGLVLSSN